MTPTDNTIETIEDPGDLTEEDRATLERLADSDREAAPIYQWYLDRVEAHEAEIQEERSE